MHVLSLFHFLQAYSSIDSPLELCYGAFPPNLATHDTFWSLLCTISQFFGVYWYIAVR